MVVFYLLVMAFFASQLCSSPSVTTANPDHDPVSELSMADPHEAHRSETAQKYLVSSTTLSAKQHHALTYETKKTVIAGQTITRSTPIIDEVPVVGADDIFNENEHHKQFSYSYFDTPKASFVLNAAEAMEKAILENTKSIIKDPYVENINGLFQPIWLMHFGELRPAFKVRAPTLSLLDLKDIYVDAENGDILLIEDTAQFVSAPSNLFVYSPPSSNVASAPLQNVLLKNLVDLREDGFLQGEYVEVRTCCKYYTCPENGPCTNETKRCALGSHSNAQQTRELIELPTESLGFAPLMKMPPSVFVDTVRCTFLPFAKASYKKGSRNLLGFFDTPVDEPGTASEMDRFSEIQAYFSVMSFFNNIRSLLNDDTWCLRKEAMSCNSDGSPTLDENGKPVNPYRVFVNQLIPDMKIDALNQSDPENFLNQVTSGRGTRENPIRINHFTRVGNAAFVPSLYTLKKSTPRADEILSDLIKPYDHNVFFQGDRDFAYDGDVVFHEFLHAITTSLVNKINSLGLDKWGIHSEPGSLNEAWADYFAAAFTEDAKIGEYASIKGGYGEVGLRDIDNNASCPNDVIGEIHNDGLIWSGALWEIRSHIRKTAGATTTKEFDRAVLASLAQAKTTEDFKTQSAKVINNIRMRDGLGPEIAEFAKEVFEKRGISDCFRAYTLSSVDKSNEVQKRTKNMIFVPSKNQIGLKNYAPATLQLEIGVPAGATAVKIKWRQFIGGIGALLGTEVRPDATKNIIPLSVLANLDYSIDWKFSTSLSIPTINDKEITTEPINAEYTNGFWQVRIPVSFEGKCDQKTMYASILSNDHKYVVDSVSVDFDMDSVDRSECDFPGSIRKGQKPSLPEGCTNASVSNALIVAFIFMLMKLRRR